MNFIMHHISSVFRLTVRECEGPTIIDSIGTRFEPDPVTPYMGRLLGASDICALVVTRSLDCFGIVRENDIKSYIIGPAARMKPDDSVVKQEILELLIKREKVDAFREYLDTVPIIPIAQFANILSMICEAVTGKNIQPERILYGEAYEDTVKSEDVGSELWSGLQDDEVTEARSGENTESDYNSERTMLWLVRRGETALLKESFRKTRYKQDFSLSTDSLRNLRDITIVSTTLVSRAAIEGGMQIKAAFALSDTYIRIVETMTNPKDIFELLPRMVVDFSEKVSSSFVPRGTSPHVSTCIKWIHHNITQPISTSDLMRVSGLSRSYLARLFVKEVGCTPMEYINNAKIEEAKTLLTSTSLPVVDIASYLGYSTNSYFHRIFKQSTSMTPSSFREKEEQTALKRYGEYPLL